MSGRSPLTVARRMLRCIGSLLALPLLYYGIQAALRTPSRSPGWIIAHRGGLKYAPENTLAAFRNAIAQGADWLEFDVQMTRDGQLLVIHDETVDRTTNGTGAVRDLTLEQLRGLDAGNREKVPPFAEVLQLAKASRIRIMPETKSAHLYPGLEEKLVQAVEDAGYIDQTIVQSFEGDSLEKLHRLNPNLQLCQLYRQWQFDTSNPHGEAQFVCPLAEMVLLDPGMIRHAHNHGRQIIVWFGAIESPFTVKVLRFFGADGFIVNDPPAAKAALGR